MREDKKLHLLVQQTFVTDAGAQLLEELELQYCRRVFDGNTNQMAYNCGQSDLVQLLKALTIEEIT